MANLPKAGLPKLGQQLDFAICDPSTGPHGASVGPYDVTPGAIHFWNAVGEHRVEIRRCGECGQHSHPRQDSCEHCFSGRLEWVAVPGTGEVYTFSTVHRPPAPDIPVPYTLGFVRLDEDVYLFTELLDGEDPVRIGARVSPEFVEAPHGTLVKFRVTGGV